MLTKSDVRPKAMLSISAMIYAFCQSHSECVSEEPIRLAVRNIEQRIGIACRSTDTKEEQNVLLALKALGNAGVIINSTETLKNCYLVGFTNIH